MENEELVESHIELHCGDRDFYDTTFVLLESLDENTADDDKKE